jgi:ABC-type cobalamin/Fe3+-siderophores transport system ATPase subunit
LEDHVSWRVTVRNVRPFAGCERWTLDAVTRSMATTVYADVIAGRARWLQWEGYIEPDAEADLEAQVIEHIHRVLVHHEVGRQLDEISGLVR